MKRIVAVAFLMLGFFPYAQTIGNSPYAAFGIGDVKFDNTIENSAMAGISSAYVNDFSNSFNFKNPAANKNFDLTSIKVEATNENNYFKSGFNDQKYDKHSSYLSNISIAFPLSQKMKFGLGYQPYSSKRYDIINSETVEDGVIRANRFHGEGSLNTVNVALGYSVSKELALGLRANYIFGNIYDIDEISYSNAELINGYETQNNIKNFNFTLGASYQKEKANDRKLTLGATATFGNTGNTSSQYTNSTYYYSSVGDVKNYESIIEQSNEETKNIIPSEFTIGAGYGENAKWFLGTQLDYRRGDNTQHLGNDFQFEDSYRIAAGGWILPNINNFRNYFSRVIYRYGAFYEKGNLRINNTDINKLGVTLGASFPFKSSSASRLSGIDFGLELGKRGTIKNDLINQNYFNLKIGINFSDKWFRKNLYD